MPTLTGLAPDPRQPGYRLLEVDRGRFASLPEETLDGLGLRVGQELAPGGLDRLRELGQVAAAERAALRCLARRAHARLELRIRLLRRQHPLFAVEAALERLARRGLVDDRRFAEQYAASRAARGRGPVRIIRDLVGQGVERRAAEDAVRSALADEAIDPERAVRAVATKRAAQLAGLPRPVRRRRLLGFLLRRGYGGSELNALVEEMTREPVAPRQS